MGDYFSNSDNDRIGMTELALSLASDYLSVYYLNMRSHHYVEYGIVDGGKDIKVITSGNDFFAESIENCKKMVYPGDKDRFLSLLERDTIISITYRLMLNGKPEYMNLRAVMPDNDTRHVVIGVTNIDSTMKKESELKAAVDMANKDALTGVRNKYAYLSLMSELDEKIKSGEDIAFAVVVCDINDLKKINDQKGHIEGDNYIKTACYTICSIYKHSPVFRVGGDEFVVVLRDADYENREQLFSNIHCIVSENRKRGDVIIATGMSEFAPGEDAEANDVFRRADDAMYKNKNELKGLQ